MDIDITKLNFYPADVLEDAVEAILSELETRKDIEEGYKCRVNGKTYDLKNITDEAIDRVIEDCNELNVE